MRFNELKSSLDGGKVFSVYLLEGEESYFRTRALETLKSTLIREPYLNVATFEGDAVLNGDAIASLSSMPILSDYRMTVVKEFYPKAGDIKGGLRAFLETPNKGSVLVIVNEKPCEVLKKFSSVCVVSCDTADLSLIVRWIKATAGNAGVNISAEACSKIAEYCLLDMTRVKTETDKLIAYAGHGGEITLDAVDLLVYRDAEYKIYEMTDFIAKKKFDLAVGIILEMLGRGEPSGRIISAIYNYFRRLLFVSISDKTNAETAALLGIKEFAVKKAKEQAAAFKVRALKRAMDRLGDADFNAKSGKIVADETLWINLFEIMTV